MSFWLTSGSDRFYRGGSWNGVPRSARVADRFLVAPGARDYVFGARLVRRVS